MKRTIPAILICCLFSICLISAQQPSFIKSGALQLPNSDLQRGLIWLMMPFGSDSIDFIYFSKDTYSPRVKYYADEIVSFELFQKSRRFISVLVPGDTSMIRRIAEVHFDGYYKLFSVTVGKDNLFILADRSGNMTRLDNSYELPTAENNFSVVYSYEYRQKLSSLFGDYPGLLSRIEGLQYRNRDLVGLLQDYHTMMGLPHKKYPPQKTTGSIAVVGGMTFFNSINLKTDEDAGYNPFVNFGLYGQLNSYSGPLFVRAGISGYRGNLYYDHKNYISGNYIVFMEEKISTSLLGLSFLMGTEFLSNEKITPYISFGGKYYSYLKYSNNIIREELYVNENLVITTLIEEFDKPSGFYGLIFEAGTNFSIKGHEIWLGFNYSHFLGDRQFMKRATGLSVSYFHKLF